MAGERDLVTGVIQLANSFSTAVWHRIREGKVTPLAVGRPLHWPMRSFPVTLVALARRLVVTKQNMTGMIMTGAARG